MIESEAKFTVPFEIISRELRNVGDARIVQINVCLYWDQDFDEFKELVKVHLGWELKLNQKIRRRGDGVRYVHMCTAVRCF